MYVRAYLRASTKEQDAGRARADLVRFVTERGLTIAAWYEENESGATLKRPELERLLRDCHPGDVLLVEQVDRLSRLSEVDWDKLRADLKAKQVRVVALDLPTSWQTIDDGDEFSRRMAEAVNGMMLDMLAAIARKDYTDRRRRQAQGIAKAMAEGRFGAAGRHQAECCYRGYAEGWTDVERDHGSYGLLTRDRGEISEAAV